MRFLFWNVRKNPVGPILSEIAEDYAVDVVILAECADPDAILVDLNFKTEYPFHRTEGQTTRIVIYTRFPRENIRTAYGDKFLTIRRIGLLDRRPIVLAATHLPSKLFRDEYHLWEKANQISAKIREIEGALGTSRTVLVGDLNMNPFEKGVISASGLHAVMTRAIAAKEARTIDRKSYPFFYNPMWGRFGDTTEGPAGTYYRPASSFAEYFWHIHDQVLIRPHLLDSFDEKSVRVLTECGGRKFVRKSGIPDQSRVSDHLPLLFALTT
jgi:endonuclease/exonuclease/phosphatase family protein